MKSLLNKVCLICKNFTIDLKYFTCTLALIKVDYLKSCINTYMKFKYPTSIFNTSSMAHNFTFDLQ